MLSFCILIPVYHTSLFLPFCQSLNPCELFLSVFGKICTSTHPHRIFFVKKKDGQLLKVIRHFLFIHFFKIPSHSPGSSASAGTPLPGLPHRVHQESPVPQPPLSMDMQTENNQSCSSSPQHQHQALHFPPSVPEPRRSGRRKSLPSASFSSAAGLSCRCFASWKILFVLRYIRLRSHGNNSSIP